MVKNAIRICLLASALLLAVAPHVLGTEYDWRTRTISESAAQNTENGWIARSGFALYGLAVLVYSLSSPLPAKLRYLPFGVSMILVAIWSNRPYLDNRTFDALESSLHSLAAALVGMSFVLAVSTSLLADKRRPRWARSFDLLALAIAVGVPLLMANRDDIRGVVQRIMFLASYVWFWLEVQLNPPTERAKQALSHGGPDEGAAARRA
jgi:hypothetical protein